MTQSLHWWHWSEGLEKNWHYHSLHWLEETLGHRLHWWGWEKEIWLSLDQKGWEGLGGKGIWKHLYLPKLQHHYTKV